MRRAHPGVPADRCCNDLAVARAEGSHSGLKGSRVVTKRPDNVVLDLQVLLSVQVMRLREAGVRVAPRTQPIGLRSCESRWLAVPTFSPPAAPAPAARRYGDLAPRCGYDTRIGNDRAKSAET